MLYFDILEPISHLTNAERGKLLTAMLEYGMEGKKPAFQGKLALAWGFVMPKIDRDRGNYDACVQKRKYASFCSKLSQKNLPKIDYEEWLELDEQQRRHMLTDADTWVPTTAATTNTTANTTTNTTASSSAATAGDTDPWEAEEASLEAAAAAERKKLKIWNGTLGKGVVNLTDEQAELLMDKMGLEQFDRYVSKLADFLIRTGANLRSHYSTILDWWNADCAC